MHNDDEGRELYYSHSWFRCNADRFDEWFDIETFKWDRWGCNLLAKYCTKDIEKWYDIDLFDMSSYNHLPYYCHDYLDVWWNPMRHNWNEIKPNELMMIYCADRFDDWYDHKLYFDLDKYSFNSVSNLEKMNLRRLMIKKTKTLTLSAMYAIDTWYDSDIFTQSKQELITASLYN